MNIKKIRFSNNATNWHLEPMELNKLTLLVGASGVGKTQIIESIKTIKNIAKGKSINGISWEIEFQTINNAKYLWKGEFENKGFILSYYDIEDDDDDKNKNKILNETLFLNNKIIAERTEKYIKFKGDKTVKLSPTESIINLLKEEELIKPVYEGFQKIIFSDQSNSRTEPFRLFFSSNLEKLTKKHKSLSEIQNLDEDIRTKLYLVYKNCNDTFNKIKERFIEVFPQVEDIKIAPLDKNDDANLISLLEDYPLIQIKEKGIDNWIHQGVISTGMYRTLLHISELYLFADGTVVLIDEFENSLGINCIDEITSDLINAKNSIQFILTSHHPYIINNINMNNWKVVTRKAGKVKAYDAQELNLGKSKHDAFVQLINLDEYSTGINL